MKTEFLSKEAALESRKWYLVDAKDQVVGRVATKIATILQGKDNPAYCSHNDCGGFVVVINAEQVQFTGQKMSDKKYYRHTGYVGGLKEQTAAEMIERDPQAVLYKAVKGMMPRNHLGRHQLAKLKIYPGSEHPHSAQQPTPVACAAN